MFRIAYSVVTNTQYAIRNMRYAIRDTQYAIRHPRYAIRDLLLRACLQRLAGFASFAGRHFFHFGFGHRLALQEGDDAFALILIRPRILYGSRQIRYDEIN